MTKYWHSVVGTHSVSLFRRPRRVLSVPHRPPYKLLAAAAAGAVQFYWVNYLSCWTNKTNGPVFALSIICDENVVRFSTNNQKVRGHVVCVGQDRTKQNRTLFPRPYCLTTFFLHWLLILHVFPTFYKGCVNIKILFNWKQQRIFLGFYKPKKN